MKVKGSLTISVGTDVGIQLGGETSALDTRVVVSLLTYRGPGKKGKTGPIRETEVMGKDQTFRFIP